MRTTEFDYPIVVEALKIAKTKDQRVGRDQDYYVTLEQLHEIADKLNKDKQNADKN